MTIRQKTVEYPFVTRITDLATNTTLATATRHDFTAITLDIPETSSRTFRSVIVQVTVRDRFAVITSITGWRIGIKLAAVAFSDTDVSQTLTHSGDHMSFVFHTDVTGYFTTNFGSGASQTCQVGVAFSTAAINAVQSITAKLIVTYDYDDSGQDTRVKTVRIPLDASLAALTATLAEIGTNQVPNLDSFLPEATKSYKHIWFESSFNDAGNAVTDFNLELSLDAEAGAGRGIMEQALNTAVWGFDIWVRNDMTTNATHAFKARSTVASRFSGCGFVLYVTYTYSHTSSSSFINSLIFPFMVDPGFVPQASGVNNRFSQDFWVEEPATIALVQSGALFYYTSQGGQTVNVAFGGQTTRAYVLSGGSSQAGCGSFSHRFDSGSAGGSGITLARGKNTLVLDYYASADVSSLCCLVMLNYTSGKATDGDGAHNHSCALLLNTVNTGVLRQDDSASLAPSIPETEYWLGFVGACLFMTQAVGTDASGMQCYYQSGEGPGDGWAELSTLVIYNDSEITTHVFVINAESKFRKNPNDPDVSRMDIETARVWRAWCSQSAWYSYYMWYTYHSITHSRTHDVDGYAGAGTGLEVWLFRLSDKKHVRTVTTGASGGYTYTWYDDTDGLFGVVIEDSTHVGASDSLTS